MTTARCSWTFGRMRERRVLRDEGSAVENLIARALEYSEPLADLPRRDSKIDQHALEHVEEVVEHGVVCSPLPRSDVDITKGPSRMRVRATERHRKERLLRFLESFDIHAQEEGAERRIGEHPRVERVEGCAHHRGPADVVVKRHIEVSPTEDQTVTVTRRKVAGIDVASLTLLVFWRSKRASSSCCSSIDLPFCSAAANAFIVGP